MQNRSRRPYTPEEFVLTEIPERAERIEAQLRERLSGSIEIELRESGERFYFDLSKSPIVSKVKPATSGTLTQGGEGACRISLEGHNLLRIFTGGLNPQLAMLSGKVSVLGEAALAGHFFNLVAPRARS